MISHRGHREHRALWFISVSSVNSVVFGHIIGGYMGLWRRQKYIILKLIKSSGPFFLWSGGCHAFPSMHQNCVKIWCNFKTAWIMRQLLMLPILLQRQTWYHIIFRRLQILLFYSCNDKISSWGIFSSSSFKAIPPPRSPLFSRSLFVIH